MIHLDHCQVNVTVLLASVTVVVVTLVEHATNARMRESLFQVVMVYYKAFVFTLRSFQEDHYDQVMATARLSS